MSISILLPLKENFAAEYAGAVSLFIKNTLKETKYKKNIKIFGNTNYKKIFFKRNYINISYTKNIFKSENNAYVSEFIKCQNEFPSDIIELHNRPLYVKDISKLNKNIFFFFHNDPLEMKGSKTINERLFLLNNTKKIIFISTWLKKRFFQGLSSNTYNEEKFEIINHSIDKKKINFNNKNKTIIYVGRLNSSKGYDLFGRSIIKVLNKNKDWSAKVFGDEPREKLSFDHPKLKKNGFKNHNIILKEYEKSQIAVVCSKWNEPFGRTALEAVSRGCATIISNRGGLLEATCNSGIVLKKLSENYLIKLLNKLIEDKKFLRKKQIKSYKNFFLTNDYISKKIDKLRDSIYDIKKINISFNKLKIINVYNLGQKLNHRLYNLSIGKKFTNGFIRNGFDVLEISERDFLKHNKLFKFYNKYELFDNYILETVKNYNPDIICFGHAEGMSKNLLFKIKKINSSIVFIHWNEDPMMKDLDDSINNLNKISSLNNIVDHSFVTTHESILINRKKDLKNLSFFFPPVDRNIERFSIYNYDTENDLFYAMSHGVNRAILKKGKIEERVIFLEKLLKKIKNIKYDFYGFQGQEPIWGENFYKHLIKCSMGLNLSRGKPVKYYSSNRIATLMGNGQLTFINKYTQVNDFFTDKEIVTYNSISDLASKIIFYKNNPNLLKSVAKNGQKKYFNLFNEKKIAKFLIDKTFGKNTKLF